MKPICHLFDLTQWHNNQMDSPRPYCIIPLGIFTTVLIVTICEQYSTLPKDSGHVWVYAMFGSLGGLFVMIKCLMAVPGAPHTVVLAWPIRITTWTDLTPDPRGFTRHISISMN